MILVGILIWFGNMLLHQAAKQSKPPLTRSKTVSLEKYLAVFYLIVRIFPSLLTVYCFSGEMAGPTATDPLVLKTEP